MGKGGSELLSIFHLTMLVLTVKSSRTDAACARINEKGYTMRRFTADYTGKPARLLRRQPASLLVAFTLLSLVPSISAAAAADGFGAHAYGTQVRAVGPTLN